MTSQKREKMHEANEKGKVLTDGEGGVRNKVASQLEFKKFSA